MDVDVWRGWRDSLKQGKIKCHLCPNATSSEYSSFKDFSRHLYFDHKNATTKLFACADCHWSFRSRALYNTHKCSRRRKEGRKEEGEKRKTHEMNIGYLMLVCTECGLSARLSSTEGTPEEWTDLCNMLASHSQKNMVPLLVLSSRTLSASPKIHITMHRVAARLEVQQDEDDKKRGKKKWIYCPHCNAVTEGHVELKKHIVEDDKCTMQLSSSTIRLTFVLERMAEKHVECTKEDEKKTTNQGGKSSITDAESGENVNTPFDFLMTEEEEMEVDKDGKETIELIKSEESTLSYKNSHRSKYDLSVLAHRFNFGKRITIPIQFKATNANLQNASRGLVKEIFECDVCMVLYDSKKAATTHCCFDDAYRMPELMCKPVADLENSPLNCPFCNRTHCSILALQAHLSMVHDRHYLVDTTMDEPGSPKEDTIAPENDQRMEYDNIFSDSDDEEQESRRQKIMSHASLASKGLLQQNNLPRRLDRSTKQSPPLWSAIKEKCATRHTSNQAVAVAEKAKEGDEPMDTSDTMQNGNLSTSATAAKEGSTLSSSQEGAIRVRVLPNSNALHPQGSLKRRDEDEEKHRGTPRSKIARAAMAAQAAEGVSLTDDNEIKNLIMRKPTALKESHKKILSGDFAKTGVHFRYSQQQLREARLFRDETADGVRIKSRCNFCSSDAAIIDIPEDKMEEWVDYYYFSMPDRVRHMMGFWSYSHKPQSKQACARHFRLDEIDDNGNLDFGKSPRPKYLVRHCVICNDLTRGNEMMIQYEGQIEALTSLPYSLLKKNQLLEAAQPRVQFACLHCVSDCIANDSTLISEETRKWKVKMEAKMIKQQEKMYSSDREMAATLPIVRPVRQGTTTTSDAGSDDQETANLMRDWNSARRQAIIEPQTPATPPRAHSPDAFAAPASTLRTPQKPLSNPANMDRQPQTPAAVRAKAMEEIRKDMLAGFSSPSPPRPPLVPPHPTASASIPSNQQAPISTVQQSRNQAAQNPGPGSSLHQAQQQGPERPVQGMPVQHPRNPILGAAAHHQQHPQRLTPELPLNQSSPATSTAVSHQTVQPSGTHPHQQRQPASTAGTPIQNVRAMVPHAATPSSSSPSISASHPNATPISSVKPTPQYQQLQRTAQLPQHTPNLRQQLEIIMQPTVQIQNGMHHVLQQQRHQPQQPPPADLLHGMPILSPQEQPRQQPSQVQVQRVQPHPQQQPSQQRPAQMMPPVPQVLPQAMMQALPKIQAPQQQPARVQYPGQYRAVQTIQLPQQPQPPLQQHAQVPQPMQFMFPADVVQQQVAQQLHSLMQNVVAGGNVGHNANGQQRPVRIQVTMSVVPMDAPPQAPIQHPALAAAPTVMPVTESAVAAAAAAPPTLAAALSTASPNAEAAVAAAAPAVASTSGSAIQQPKMFKCSLCMEQKPLDTTPVVRFSSIDEMLRALAIPRSSLRAHSLRVFVRDQIAHAVVCTSHLGKGMEVGTPCNTDPENCNAPVRPGNSVEGHLHSNHNIKGVKFVCLHCGMAFRGETWMVIKHMMKFHEMKLPQKMELTCPFRNDPETPCSAVFNSIHDYREHLSAAEVGHPKRGYHDNVLRTPSTHHCSLRFKYIGHSEAHNKKHISQSAVVNSNSVECCPLCGSCDLFSKDFEGKTIDHFTLHALKWTSYCRYDLQPVHHGDSAHFLDNHYYHYHGTGAPTPGKEHACKACKVWFDDTMEHVDSHLITGLRIPDGNGTEPHPIVTGDDARLLLGLFPLKEQ